MRRRLLTPLIFILVCAFGGLALTTLTGSSPELGLDLQGGVSVVLQPTKETKSGELDVALEIIRQRVDALGVAEPEIVRQGDTILVQLPGVKNKDRAIELVGQTAELRFRPVLLEIPTGSGDNTDDTDNADETTTTAADDATTSTTAGDTTAASTSTSEGALGGAGAYQPVEGESASGPIQETTTTTAPATTTTTAPGETTTTSTPTSVEDAFPLTKPEDDKPEATVNLPNKDNTAIYQLGPMPTGATGKIVEGASAELSQAGEWQVKLTMRGGANGIDIFNALAGECFSGAQTCPTGKVAIALDSIVQSAPAIREASYSRDQIQISGSFTESEAKDLALVLRYGSLPVELERQSLKTVSASLGEDSLRAGIIAGIVGLALVALYMVLYYRALGIVVILGLSVWSALLYSIVSWLGETRGLALTLAGVTGIIVSVGVTVDSYVVFFERLKDEVKAGRTLRSSTERAFKRAFRTILAADTSSFLGAAVLWWLTVGSVRGFAFFLGLSTILDVLVAWFFTRPVVSILAQNRVFTEAPVLGVARGLAAPASATPAAGAGK